MKKYFTIFILIIFILNLTLQNPVLVSAANDQVADKGVHSCKGYTNKSKIMWGKIALSFKDYEMIDDTYTYKVTILRNVTRYELAVDKYNMTIDKVVKIKDVEPGTEFIVTKLPHEINNTKYHVINEQYHLIKADNKLVKVEKPSDSLMSKFYCIKIDNDVKADPMYKTGAAIIKKIITPKMSEFEQVKAINDYIAKNTRYDMDNYVKKSIPAISYTKEGVFKKGVAVCNGYAEATKFLLDIAGFRNEFITGKANGLGGWLGHAWNAVKVDGKWYYLDTTWNDPVTKDRPNYVRYDYFLISKEKLSKDHRWNSDIIT
jgi:transglutaminase/protease-like cytokinesis protein 3